jgi:hypothetical protein
MGQSFGSPIEATFKRYEHWDITSTGAVRVGEMAGRLRTCALRSLYPVPVSQTFSASLAYTACKLTDVFRIQLSAVSSRPVYSALMNSGVLPIVNGLDPKLASMDFCLAKTLTSFLEHQ